MAPAFVIALLITTFVGEKTVVLGRSMEPNLHQDEQLIVDKLSYRFHYPERGDIVIIDVPDTDLPLIKRVIGLPGETLEIVGDRVFINGQALPEPYLSDTAQRRYGPIEIPPEHVFVMGDNRGASRDSRSIGPVHIGQIMAKAWVRVWPVEEMGILE
jgi:signal peptidase I